MTEPTKLRPQEIELQEVESGNIARIGYDKESQTLVVEFKHGGKYAYKDVPEETHQALIEAKSIGGYFHSAIRHKFESVKLQEFSEEETA